MGKSVEVTIRVEVHYRHAETGLGRQGYPVGLYYYNKFRTLEKNKAKTIQEDKCKDRHKRSFGLSNMN